MKYGWISFLVVLFVVNCSFSELHIWSSCLRPAFPRLPLLSLRPVRESGLGDKSGNRAGSDCTWKQLRCVFSVLSPYRDVKSCYWIETLTALNFHSVTFPIPAGVAPLTPAVLHNFGKYVDLLWELRRNVRIWWLFLLCACFFICIRNSVVTSATVCCPSALSGLS